MNIVQHNPADAWDLIFPAHLATLEDNQKDIMHDFVMKSQWVWIGDVDGEVFGFWGIIAPTFLSDSAYIWFYHTPAIAKHQRAFIRHSRKVTAELLSHYPLLIGHGRLGDDRSLRWLAWCGAQFGEPIGSLIPFEIKAPNYG